MASPSFASLFGDTLYNFPSNGFFGQIESMLFEDRVDTSISCNIWREDDDMSICCKLLHLRLEVARLVCFPGQGQLHWQWWCRPPGAFWSDWSHASFGTLGTLNSQQGGRVDLTQICIENSCNIELVFSSLLDSVLYQSDQNAPPVGSRVTHGYVHTCAESALSVKSWWKIIWSCQFRTLSCELHLSSEGTQLPPLAWSYQADQVPGCVSPGCPCHLGSRSRKGI